MLRPEAALKDVFISFSTADQADADRIVAKLREVDLNVWYAPADIRGGEVFVQKIEEGLRSSHVVVTLLSRSAVDSFWVQAEVSARLVQMSRDRARRLLPVLLGAIDDDQVPVLLQPLDRIDFRGVDLQDPLRLEEKVQELVRGIRGESSSRGSNVVGIPLVIYAMTDQEASELTSGNVFQDAEVTPGDRQRFLNLANVLEAGGICDLLRFYGKTREAWRPSVASATTIRETVEEVIQRVNAIRQSTADQPIVRPQFFSTDFLSDDALWRVRTWDRLSKSGCMLVIDALSMFHPGLRQKLLSSEFGSNPRVSIVVMSPIGPQMLPINQLLETEISLRMQRAFDRFSEQLDLLCEFGVGDMRALRRWLFSVIPETAKTVQGLKPDALSRERLREQLGQPVGIDRLVIGRG